MLETILGFAKEVVMKYGTKSLVASLCMYLNYILATKVQLSPTIVITSLICNTVIAISFFFFKHIQEVNNPQK